MQSPEDAVRCFLEAESRNEPTAHLTAGQLTARGLLDSAVNAANSVQITESVVNIKRLTTTAVNRKTATVDLDAYVVMHVRFDTGASDTDSRYQGPVELVNTDGQWLITSMVVDGVRLPEEQAVAATTQLGAVRVMAATRIVKRHQAIVVAVSNEGDQRVVLRDVRFGKRLFGRFLLQGGARRVPTVLDPGQDWHGYVRVVGPRSSAVKVDATIDGRHVALEAPPPPRARRRLSEVVVLHAVAGLAAVDAAALPPHRTGLLGFALVASGAALLGRASTIFAAGFLNDGWSLVAAAGLLEAILGVAAVRYDGSSGWGALVLGGSVVSAYAVGLSGSLATRAERARRATSLPAP